MPKRSMGTAVAPYDLVLCGGLVVDGSGAEPFLADVAIRNGKVADVGSLDAGGAPIYDAQGCIVTPGFIDVHTHYDGQALWSDRLSPSSSHGVTTVVLGNCGVGFAPCREADRATLIDTMEGVEDIPGIVMAEGLDWQWETFEDYLDQLESRPHDIDVAAYLPHSALRLHVMGQRGADREAATQQDLLAMYDLTVKALRAGAMGVSTSRFALHRRGDGAQIPSYCSDEVELTVFARAIRDTGRGILQVIPDSTLSEEAMRAEFAMFARLSEAAGSTLTFTLLQNNAYPDRWRTMLSLVQAENSRRPGALAPQIYPRPLGMLMGFELSLNPFVGCPGFRDLESLCIDEKLARLRQTAVRERLLRETRVDPGHVLARYARDFEHMFALGDPPDYEPHPDRSIAALAAQEGRAPLELCYDLMLERDGRGLLMVAAANFAGASLDHFAELAKDPSSIVALGDGGAHYGFICDSTYPTTLLTHWWQDRDGVRFALPTLVRWLTSDPADLMRLTDRGLIRPGLKADINVIDLAKLRLEAPFVVHDLPSAGRRLLQTATGYRATIVNGRLIQVDGRPTDARPGRLVRGAVIGNGPTNINLRDDGDNCISLDS